nr:threonine dehydratase/deaminase [Haemonchus contortus]
MHQMTSMAAEDIVDGVIAVREGNLAIGILKMFEEEHIVLDGAGAIGPAALLSRNIEGLSGKRVVCILSSGNTDSSFIGRTIEKGLAIDDRLIQVIVTVPDMVGGFAELFEIFGKNGSSVVEFLTDGVFHRFDVCTVEFKIVAEVSGLDHAIQLNEAILARYGPHCRFSLSHRTQRINA